MNMTTAKKSSKTTSPDSSRTTTPQSLEATDELENIAKQISDHAEAIYQEWKARGLAPSEILKCHPESDSSFSQSFNPPKYNNKYSGSVSSTSLLEKAPELSNINLNQLVNSFVNEDKARIASQLAENHIKRESCSAIKYTIKKNEQLSPVSQEYPSSAAADTPCSNNNNRININNLKGSGASSNSNSSSSSPNNLSKLNFQVPDVLKDTIEKCAKLQKPEAPVKPEYLLNHIPQWPFNFKKPCQNQIYR